MVDGLSCDRDSMHGMEMGVSIGVGVQRVLGRNGSCMHSCRCATCACAVGTGGNPSSHDRTVRPLHSPCGLPAGLSTGAGFFVVFVPMHGISDVASGGCGMLSGSRASAAHVMLQTLFHHLTFHMSWHTEEEVIIKNLQHHVYCCCSTGGCDVLRTGTLLPPYTVPAEHAAHPQCCKTTILPHAAGTRRRPCMRRSSFRGAGPHAFSARDSVAAAWMHVARGRRGGGVHQLPRWRPRRRHARLRHPCSHCQRPRRSAPSLLPPCRVTVSALGFLSYSRLLS
jgi:acid phosphatase family membrane protein YuiD